MSNIAELLQQIITARYGREVRQSIHDAIEACYNDGKSGATDLTARQLINDVKGDVDNLRDDFDGLEEELTKLIDAKTVIFDASSTTTIQNVLDAFKGGAVCLMKAGEGLFLLSSVNEDGAAFYRVQSGENMLTVVETYSRTTDDYYWKYNRKEIATDSTLGAFKCIYRAETQTLNHNVRLIDFYRTYLVAVMQDANVNLFIGCPRQHTSDFDFVPIIRTVDTTNAHFGSGNLSIIGTPGWYEVLVLELG